MDELQLHLLYNHVPLIGTFAAFLVFLIGMVMRNNAVRMAGLAVYVVMALTIVPTYLSGEGAEEKVEHVAGISNDAIKEHEEHAELALWLMVAAAVIGIVTFIAFWKTLRTDLTTGLSILFIVAAVAGFIKVGITAHEGGEIRRPDLGAPPSPESKQ